MYVTIVLNKRNELFIKTTRFREMSIIVNKY